MDAFTSARAMLMALRDEQISATALVEFHLAHIARYNHELNAIVIPNYAQARLRAGEADAGQRWGESLGAFHGLPLVIKDSIEVAGLRTMAGIAARTGVVSVEHAPLVGSCSARPTCRPMPVTGRPIIRSLGGPTTPGT